MMKRVMKPVLVFCLVTFLVRFAQGVSVTSYVLFLRSIGITLGGVGILEGGYRLFLLACEVPTGMLADGKSRAWSLRVGIVIWTLAVIGFGFTYGLWTALLAECAIGVGNAFISGAQQAWVKDALDREGGTPDERQLRTRHAFAQSYFIGSMGWALGGLAGSYVSAIISLRSQWFLAGGALACSGWIIFTQMDDRGEPFVRVKEGRALQESLKALRASSALRWIVVFVAVSFLTLPFRLQWAVLLRDRFGQVMVGWVWLPLAVVGAFASWIVQRIHPKQESLFLILILGITGVSIALSGMLWKTSIPILGVAMLYIGTGVQAPLVEIYVQNRIQSSYRATFGSLVSMVGSLSGVAVMGIMALASRDQRMLDPAIAHVWCWVGGSLVVCVVALMMNRPHHDR